MTAQLWALLVLKFHISRHTFTAGRLLSTLFLAFVLVAGGAAAFVGSVALFRLAAHAPMLERPAAVLLALDLLIGLYIILWGGGLLGEMQRADIIDLRKMLYLPVSLRAIYALNFAASLFRPANLLFLPLLGAFMAGLIARKGAAMAPGPLLAALFLLMFGAWAYYLRGLFAIFTENKRRRAYALALISMLVVLLAQVPSLLLQEFRGEDGRFALNLEHHPLGAWLLLLNQSLPPGWLAYGTQSLHENRPAAAWLCAAGLAGMAALGLALGYRATLRYFLHGPGETGHNRRETAVAAATPFTLRPLPPLDPETAALVRAFLLGLLRHPFIRMQMIMPFVMGFMMVFVLSRRQQGMDPLLASLNRDYWLLPALLIWPFAGFVNIFFNQFGTDRDAFRAMVLLPAPRHKYLLAKNLALFPVLAALVTLFLLAGMAIAGMTIPVFAQGLLLMAQLYLAYCIAGNFISLYFPYRFQHSGMSAPSRFGNRFGMSLAYLACTLLIFSPTLISLLADEAAAALGLVPPLPAGLLVAVLLLAFTALLWRITLIHAGDLLLDREQRILAALVRDRE